MMLLGTCSNPKLWLAAAAAHDNPSSEEQDDQLGLGIRSLRVLVVEDEFFISLHMKELLETLGHEVVAIAVSADQAVNIAATETPGCCSYGYSPHRFTRRN